MFSHVSVGTGDLGRAIAFYDAVLAPLGIAREAKSEGGAGWRRDGEAGMFWVGVPFDGSAASSGNGWMAAFSAPSRAAVDAAYRAAIEAGGRDEGPPGMRPQYAADYYGAYVRDLDGNKIHFVRRGAA